MSGKGISRKAQDSGTAGSGSSESKRLNCSKINAEGATINSGCGSGNKDLKEVREHITTMKDPSKRCKDTDGYTSKRCKDTDGYTSKRCKGTDGYNDIRIPLARKTHNFGAFSGKDNNRHGTSSNPEGSNVNGTRNSFNATGTGPTKHPTVPGSENSFNDKTICREATVHAADGCRRVLVGGTQGSFNVNGKGSKIDARGAIINSGCGAGTGDAKGVSELIGQDPPEDCSGTMQAFNAGSGGQININDARLNIGAYSGSAT